MEMAILTMRQIHWPLDRAFDSAQGVANFAMHGQSVDRIAYDADLHAARDREL